MKAGAADYVIKERLVRLAPAVRGALAERRASEQKEETEEALHAAARQWHTTFDAIADGIMLLDPEGEILRCNKAMGELVGKSCRELIGESCWPFVHGTTGPPKGCLQERMRESRKRESAVLERNGQWLDVTLDPLFDGSGQIVGAVHIMSDITHRKEAEHDLNDALEEAEGRSAETAALLKGARAILAHSEFEEAARVIFDCCKDLLGATAGYVALLNEQGEENEVLFLDSGGRDCTVDPSLPMPIRGLRAEAYESSRAKFDNDFANSKWQEYLPSGHVRLDNVLFAPLTINHETVGLLGLANKPGGFTNNDARLATAFGEMAAIALKNTRAIDALQLSEETVRSNLRFLETLLDTIPSPVFYKDADGIYRGCNAAFAAQVLGLPKERIIGCSPYDLPNAIPRDLAELYHRQDLELTRSPGPRFYEAQVQCADDERHDFLLHKATFHEATGQVAGIIGVMLDITKRKQLESQLRQTTKMETIGQLAGGVAHDFNNILTGIKGYAQFLLSDTEDGAAANRDVREVLRLTDRAAGLTRQLLAFSRKQTLQPVVLDLNALIGDAAKMLKRLIGEHIELRVRPAENLGRVQADPGQIEQVLMNLAVNARDAMPNGGELTIETANIEFDEGHAATHVGVAPGLYAMFAVTDTGCGMDRATVDRVFEPFFTTKETGKGTGLGLATAYGIVKQHDGSIWVYSEPGHGSTFKVYLPRANGPASDSAPANEGASVPGGSETILVVEDEEPVRRIAQRALEAHGYTVLAAADAPSAMTLLSDRGKAIDLLLTDVVMPGGSGPELYERIRAERPSLRVMYMSGYTDDAIGHHGVLDVGVRFISKPFDPLDLARSVREALDGS